MLWKGGTGSQHYGKLLTNCRTMLNYIKALILNRKSRFKRRFLSNISSKVFFGPNVQILGMENVLIKDNCTIGGDTLFTINNRDNKDIQLEIGRNSYIGRDNFFSVGKSIVIGDYCIFGNKCSFICSDHIFDNPLVPYALSGNSYEKTIRIGVNCWLGHDVSVIGNINIGHGCVIGAKTLITKDIPPFSMVVGNPARIVRSFNFDSGCWEKGEQQLTSIYHDERTYLESLVKHSKDLPLGYHSASHEYGDL